jgi:hypothetical protein
MTRRIQEFKIGSGGFPCLLPLPMFFFSCDKFQLIDMPLPDSSLIIRGPVDQFFHPEKPTNKYSLTAGKEVIDRLN